MAAERRREERFADQLPVRVLNRRLTVKVSGVELVSADVSRTGLQLVCPELYFIGIQAQVKSRRLAIEIELVSGARLHADCNVAYVSEVDDEVLIGVRIESFQGAGASEWEDYIVALETCGAI